MATELSNECRYLLLKKVMDFSADTFKIRVMASGFVFNKDSHTVWADVSASELANGNGYVTGGNTLSGISVTKDDTLDRGRAVWGNTSWTASGGSIGPSPGAIIIDDTVASPVIDPIIGYIDFGGEKIQTDGGIFTIVAPEVRI
jgi:hypothetical protein